MLFARYEILLPLRYNDGTPVEPEKFEQTKEELLNRFQGLTIDPGTIRGFWVYQGEQFEDELIRFVIDVEDTPETEQFLFQLFLLIKLFFLKEKFGFQGEAKGKVSPTGHLDDCFSIANSVAVWRTIRKKLSTK